MAYETGPGCVRPSTFVGIPAPDPGPDRMRGVTSMMPIETIPHTTRWSDNGGGVQFNHNLNMANDAKRRMASVLVSPDQATNK